MNKIKYIVLSFFLACSFLHSFSQNITYKIHSDDSRLAKHLVPKETIDLNDGDILIRKGENIVDIFKQNLYPQELVRVSKDNELKQLRKLQDTVVFKMAQFAGKPRLFIADARGQLKAVTINSETLHNEEVNELVKLTSSKKSPKKINDFLFPEIVFSEDASVFGVLQAVVKEKSLTFVITVYDSSFKEVYANTVTTPFNSSYSFRMRSSHITNSGKVLFAGTDSKEKLHVYSISPSKTKEYIHRTPADKRLMSYSDIGTNQAGQCFFYTYEVSKKNVLEKLSYTLLNEELTVIATNDESINLTYPKGAVGGVVNYQLLFKNLISLDNGEFLLVSEYGSPTPEPTLLGTLLIQKLKSGYYYSGPILAIHLNSDMSVKNVKLILKHKRPSIKLIGHHLLMLDDTANFLIYDSPNNQEANLIDYQWNLTDNTTSKKIIFNHKEVSKFRFILNAGFSSWNNQVMLGTLPRKRVLISFE